MCYSLIFKKELTMNKGKVVSGGSNGIGKSIVKLLRKNITVYNLDIQTDACEHYFKCNLR